MKIIKKIFLISFACFLFFNIFSLPVSAGIKFKPQVAIGSFMGEVMIETDSIGKYITEVYKYLIGIVGILATVVMMIGGVIWIGAGGNASRVSEAKAWISGALMGLVLTLSSYMILNTINPDLVTMKKLDITHVDEVGCCLVDDKALYSSEDKCTEKLKGTFNTKQKPDYDGKKCIDLNVYSGPTALNSTDDIVDIPMP